MVEKSRNYTITKDILTSYRKAALTNAKDLLNDSQILLNKNRFARSYALAVSAIEEVGKAFQAWSSMERNFNDPGVQSALKRNFEDHTLKTLAGLISIILQVGLQEKDVWEFVADTSTMLILGREKAMYVDVSSKKGVTIPQKVVSERNARDTLKLAQQTLLLTTKYISENKPNMQTTFDDKFLQISSKNAYLKMAANVDFWYYYIDYLGKAQNKLTAFNESVVKYYEQYYTKQKLFKKQENGSK